MAYPPGVTTCPVSIKAPVTFGGADATVHLEVAPAVRLIWTATGQTFADFIEQPADATGGEAAVLLPHSQPGFQDEAGNAVLSWHYVARVRFAHEGKTKHVPLKNFTIPPGQPAIDLALIPSGPAAPTVTTPSYFQIARTPELLITGTVTRDAGGAPISAAVVWPDGTSGVFAGVASVAFPGSLDSYTITYGDTRIYTQPTVTRDASGNITNQPAIVLS